MALLGYILSGRKLKKAQALTDTARKKSGEDADLLYQEAFRNLAEIPVTSSNFSDALHFWGFALLHQGLSKPADQAIKIFEEALSKFSICQSKSPDHLGAALDAGVALLGLAKAKGVNLDHEIFVKAKESFLKANEIQNNCASYNIACMNALQNDGDACLESLEKARDSGHLPNEEDIINDDDLENVKQMPWFDEFIASLADEEDDKEVQPSADEKNEETKE